jgi:cytoskeletal protein CcmA (bactofilin family)
LLTAVGDRQPRRHAPPAGNLLESFRFQQGGALAVDLSNAARLDLDDVSERRANAWIGKGVTIEGRIIAAQDLRIDGRVDGTIDVGQQELILGAGAELKADVTGRSILVGGAVTGNITATERIQIQATGSVAGDVKTPRLIVHDGGVLEGKVDVEGKARGER